MTCAELRDSYDLHALGIAEDPQRAELARHLSANCPICVPAMRTALGFTANLVTALSEEHAPPRRLRARIISSVAPARVGARVWAWAAFALALLTVQFVWHRAEIGRRDEQLARAQAVVEFLHDPATRQIASQASSQVYVNPARGVLFLGNELPALASGRVFEFWLIPPGQAPRPAGLFVADAAGQAVHLVPGPFNPGATAAVAVSIEPALGSPSPTTTPILVVSL